MSVSGGTQRSLLQEDQREYRIALTAGRVSIPPSYFLIDLLSSLSGQFRFEFTSQRFDAPPAVSALLDAPPARSTSIVGCVRRLISFRPDIIHQHWATWSTPAVVAARVLRVPLVVSVHGYDAFLPRSPGAFGRVVDLVKRLERKVALRAASAVVVNSDFMRDRVAELGVRDESIRLIRHVVDVDKFIPGPAERSGIVYVGRLSVEKGCDILIRAVSLMSVETYERLIIVGAGPDESMLRDLASSLNVECEFRGSLLQDEVIAELQAAKVAVVPSKPARGQVEASGITPLEAQACGTPTVVTRVGGLPENIPDRFEGLICDPNPESMASAVSLLLGADLEAVGRKVRKHVVTYHHRKLLGANFRNLYFDLLAGY